jgi:YD repeat-containing protein
VTKYAYNTNEQLTNTVGPNGLVITNGYGGGNYLALQVAVGFSTNIYTYTNGLVYTHTDERGLTVTNSWDPLQRLTNVAYPDGTSISYIYTNLDLIRVVDRMGFTNSFSYDAIRQKTSATDPLGHAIHYGYCDCGALYSITDALSYVTYFMNATQGSKVCLHQLNIPTACPPRTVVPVNTRAAFGGSFNSRRPVPPLYNTSEDRSFSVRDATAPAMLNQD